MKSLSLAFLAVCLIARVFRARIKPFLARMFPPALPRPLARGMAVVDSLSTVQLAAVLKQRIIDDDARADQRRRADEIVHTIRSAILPPPPTSPPKE